jgi:hypothetical protein
MAFNCKHLLFQRAPGICKQTISPITNECGPKALVWQVTQLYKDSDSTAD